MENFQAGTLEKLGARLGSPPRTESRLILVRVSGYGQTGPYKDGARSSPTSARRWVVYATLPASPAGPGAQRDLLGRLARLSMPTSGRSWQSHARDVLGTGEGQVVGVALYEAVFNLMESLIPEYDVAGIVRERTGSSFPASPRATPTARATAPTWPSGATPTPSSNGS